jgi:GH24 family phage-related lysozyme (muramidase)
MKRNPSLFSHVKSFEKMEASPYEDVGGYAIGYGAHTDKDGNPVTKDTAAVDEATATTMLARDLLARRNRLAGALPGWDFMPGAARQALLDVSMGRDDILSKAESRGLHTDLAAAGKDPEKLMAAVKKHYYSYRTSKNPKDQAGLEARRVAGGKLFFGEDFSYDGKTWDAKLGFVKKGGK